MNLRNSIVTRFALFFTGLIILSILLSGYLVFSKATKVITENSKERLKHTSELAAQAFYSLLNEVTNDIAVVTQSPTLKHYINNPTGVYTKDIDELFHNILKNKQAYYQIRLIDANSEGKEIVRFNKENNEVLKSKSLQEKGDRKYFKEARKVNRGENYFSHINLNEEYGVISIPKTPTLRVACPIFDQENNKVAILIINVNLNPLYHTLDQIAGTDGQFYLIDSEGQYLYSKNRSNQFGFQTKDFNNFFHDFNTATPSPDSLNVDFKQLNNDAGNSYLSHFQELSYSNGLRKISLISTMEQSILLQSALTVRSFSIQTLAWTCLLSILLSLLFTKLFSNKINRITSAISNYDQGISDDIDLPLDRKDEIGILANTFSNMRTKINQHVSDLNSALEKEQLARKERDEFLQNMSHEMRTPLNAILGLSKLLYKNAIESQIPIINSLEISSKSLSGLVYDVLDHQKLIEGKLRIQPKPTLISQLIKDIYATYQYEAVQKGLAFNLSIDRKLESQIFYTDPLRLSQIIINLVVNAIKYTNKGKINIVAKITGRDNQILEVRIKDTGIGVHQENLGKINDRFFRERDTLTGRYGDYGLGLSIVKQLTSLFGGTLRASSQKGIGSEFWIAIPVIPATEANPLLHTPTHSYSLPVFSSTYKVLHIEDDLPTMELIKHLLDHNHILLTQTNNLNNALTTLETSPPDLIISDIMLASKNIRSTLDSWVANNVINCPMLVVSALEPSESTHHNSIYIQKPFAIDFFKDIVFKILGQNEYGKMNFNNTYKNYDYNTDKIDKALKILEGEFETYIDRIHKVAISKDQSEWVSIQHKLITHINNLELTLLSSVLPELVSNLDNKVENIKSLFSYYLCCIRVERSLNLIDRS